MYALLVFVILQGLSTPRTNSVPAPEKQQGTATSIGREKGSTTPSLSPDTELHLEMERELGGQGVEIGGLKEKTDELERERNQIDRPDIDSLKLSREHTYWIIAGIGSVLGFIFFLRKFLWGAVLPYLRRAIVGNPSITD